VNVMRSEETIMERQDRDKRAIERITKRTEVERRANWEERRPTEKRRGGDHRA